MSPSHPLFVSTDAVFATREKQLAPPVLQNGEAPSNADQTVITTARHQPTTRWQRYARK